MKLSDKNKDYEINHHQIAYEIMEKIKANNNMWTIDDSNHNTDAFDVRFYMVGDDEELFRWSNARKIPRIGEQVTDFSVSGRSLYDIKWYTVQEIFHLNDCVVVCVVSLYQPLKMKHMDVEKPLKRI